MAANAITLAQVLPFLLQDGCLPAARLLLVRRAARSLVQLLRRLYTPAGITKAVATKAKEAVAGFFRHAVAAYPVDEAAADSNGAGLGLLCGKVRLRRWVELLCVQGAPAHCAGGSTKLT